MSIIPILSAREVMRRLIKAGFKLMRVQGSHYIFQHPVTNKITSVPLHGGKTIGRSLVTKIIKQAGLTVNEFLKL